MADLIAQGTDPQHRWRRTLPPGRQIMLGRASGAWSVPWDEHVSREHAAIEFQDGHLDVEQLPVARNPIFISGRQVTRFQLRPGDHFVIGQTTFTLADDQVNVSLDLPQPLREQSFSPQYLKRLQFRNADQRIEILSRLPDVISGATSDSELFVRLVNLLLAGVARAGSVAVVAVESANDSQPGDGPVRVLHWDRRLVTGGDFQPSENLIREAVARRESVLHVWGAAENEVAKSTAGTDNADWAFCTPVLGDACRGWGIYIAGRFTGDVHLTPTASDPTDLRDDLKFTELVAATLSSLRGLRTLQRRHTSLSQFFSPLVLEALEGGDPNVVLAPREASVSVLFCDLRGFSRRSERAAGNLLDLLQRVSKALGVMTRHILDQGGVVGDFQGDAAMGFWGWPLASDDSVERTCLAALGIRAEYEAAAKQPDHPLADFRMGIGIATGRAVAGKIGTVDQVKVTVFGPVVNLASRLEEMTKLLRAPILLDEPTARVVREHIPRTLARCRRLAVVKPYGMETPVTVSELLPPEAEYPLLTDQHVADYEAALDALLDGRWQRAFEMLHRVPAEDRAKDFLTVFIAQHNRTPPPNWDGVIPLGSKG